MNTESQEASSKTLENRADTKREEISDTLDKLERKLSPSQLMDEAMSLAREHGGGIAQKLASSARDNPLPLILTGIGLAWLMASQSNDSRRSYDYRGIDRSWDDGLDNHRDDFYREDSDTDRSSGSYQFARDRSSIDGSEQGTTSNMKLDLSAYEGSSDGDSESVLDTLGDKAGELSDAVDRKRRQLTQQGRSVKADVEANAGRWREQGRGHANGAATQIRHYFQQEPLVAGALAIALGAVIGSMLPATDREDQHLGEHSDELKDNVTQQAKSATQATRKQVEDVAQSAKKTASDKLTGERESSSSTVA